MIVNWCARAGMDGPVKTPTKERDSPSPSPTKHMAMTNEPNDRDSAAQIIAKSDTTLAIKSAGRLPIPIDSGTQRKQPRPMKRVGPVASAFNNHGSMICGMGLVGNSSTR